MVARHDLATDPAVLADLATVRLGEAFFRRALAHLDDAALDAPTALPGWTRRHLVAHVGYNARAIARLVDWAATGVENPMYSSSQARADEIDLGATLNPAALRNLSDHASIDLDVRWRDLPADRWGELVTTAQGRRVPIAESVWMRTREVWLHATDLRSGQGIHQIPPAVSNRLLDDIVAAWARRDEMPDVLIEVQDATGRTVRQLGQQTGTSVAGRPPDLLRWAAGRPIAPSAVDDLTWGGRGPITAPRWL